MSQSASYGAILLRNQLREILKNPIDGFSIGLEDDSNIYEWRVMMEGPTGFESLSTLTSYLYFSFQHHFLLHFAINF